LNSAARSASHERCANRPFESFLARSSSPSAVRPTVKLCALDGKPGRGQNAVGCGRSEYDNKGLSIIRDLSASIALQRTVSTVSLTVSVQYGAQNARRNKRLSGSEMIEWE
jgi:hypothetical protein